MVYDAAIVDFQYGYNLKQSKSVYLVTDWKGNLDCNYLFGVQADFRLAADFEDMNSGLNHPVIGTTALSTGVWHHCAATSAAALQPPRCHLRRVLWFPNQRVVA